MMSYKLLVSTLAAAALVGCGSPAALTTSPTTTDTNTALAPEAAFQGERHIMATGSSMSFDDIRSQIPQQISAADAERLLVSADQINIAADDATAPFSIQQRRGGGGYGGYGGHRSFGRGFHRGFAFHRGFNRFNNFRFFRHRNFFFPFVSHGSFYRPYFNNYSYPFLYNYNNTCYPYTYRY